MESKADRNRSDVQALDRTRAREAVELMVKREEARAGSRMLAYGIVGRRVGRSASWVRRYLGGVEVGFAHETFCRIRDAYVAHCERQDRELEIERKRAAVMKAQADAAEQDFLRLRGEPL